MHCNTFQPYHSKICGVHRSFFYDFAKSACPEQVWNSLPRASLQLWFLWEMQAYIHSKTQVCTKLQTPLFEFSALQHATNGESGAVFKMVAWALLFELLTAVAVPCIRRSKHKTVFYCVRMKRSFGVSSGKINNISNASHMDPTLGSLPLVNDPLSSFLLLLFSQAGRS